MAKSKKAAAASSKDMEALVSKQNRQKKELEKYKNQKKWMGWATGAIAVLILLLILTMGYASNWWPDASKTASFSPTASKQTDTTTTPDTQTRTTTTTNNGGGTPTSTDTRSTTTNNTTTTTTNNTTTNGGGTPAPAPASPIIDLRADIHPGDNVDAILEQARSLGLGVNCHIELLTVRVCDISDGTDTITLKNLITSGVLTGILSSF